MRGVHDRPGSHRGLLMTLGALPMVRLGIEFPALVVLAVWTLKAFWPALLRQIFGAGRVIRKHRHELLK